MILTNTYSIAELPDEASTEPDIFVNSAINSPFNLLHFSPPPASPVITAVTSTKTDGTYTLGEQISITITFDQAVDVTGIPQLTLETGTIDRVIDYVAGSGSNTLTFSYTVQAGDSSADLDYHDVAALALNGGTIKLSGDTTDADLTLATPGTANSLGANQALVINTSIPTVNNVTISSATGIQNNSLNAGDVVSVTVTMSEDTTVTGTPQLALNIGGSTVNADYSSGSGSTALVFSYTIAAGLNDSDGISIASNSVNLNGGSLNSALGNAADLSHTAVADNSNYLVDTSKPATPAAATLDAASDSGVSSSDGKTNINTPTFKGVTEAFATVNLYDTGGAVVLGTTTADSSGNWSVTVTQDPATTLPLAGTHSVSIRAVDRAGNISNASGNTNITIDTTAPALAQTITLSDTALKIGDTAIITIKFTEAVSGLTTADLNVPNGRITGLTTSNGGITWTGTLTPNANVTNTSNLVRLDNTGYTDLAGNAGSGSSNSPNYTIDTVRPTLASAITISDTALKIGDAATVTLVFSEAITSFTTADLTARNGTLSNLTTGDGGITWTVTLAPNANASNNSNVITLDYTGINDLNGNAGTGSATSGNYGVDTLRPTATVVVANPSLTAASTSLVTITFNEAVSGFNNANLAVANGNLTTVTSGNGGITWTATLTPASGVVAASNVITLNYTGVSDSAGNAATGITNSNNYAITAGANLAPTDIMLSSSGIVQTAADNTSVGTLIAMDPNPGDTASFSLVAGASNNSNDKFSISGNSLIAKRPLEMASGNYTVLVRATDAAGSAYEKNLVITVTDNIAPFATAIKRVQSESSNLGTLEYKVSFSEAVTGVNPAAFSLLTTGNVSGSISGITQLDASNYIVSISNLTGDGTLGLNLKNTGTGILDKASLTLNGGFTGQLYQIDHTRPTTGISKLSFSNDDGVSNSDFITTASVQTISGNLSAPLAADERVLVSPDNGNSWLTATANPGARQWSLTGQTLEGSNTLLIKVSDAAGNAGNTLSQNYSILRYDAAIDSDADGDGAYMSTETLVPNLIGDGLGDGNGDGIADQSQNAVTSLQWLDHSSSPHYLTLSNTQHILQKEVATKAVINSATEIQFPYGSLSAQLEGFSSQAEVSLSLYTTADSAVNGFWTQTATGEWMNLATNITASGNKLKVDFKILDGGPGDLDGKADGKISFSAGLGNKTEKAETIAVKPSTSLPNDKDGDGIPDAIEARVGTKLDVKDNDVLHRSDLFAMQLYRDVLFREADTAGVQYWQGQIDSGKMSRAQVAASFMESAEFQGGIGGITRLYFGAFDRLPDRDGLAYWMQAQKDGMNLSKISASFVSSAEFQKTYGALDNTAFVDRVYQNVLHRSSDAAGKAYWLGQLGNGLSRGDMLAGFTESTEFKANSQSKVSLTLDYIGLLGHAPDQATFDALLSQSGTDVVTLIGQFINSPEYLARFMPV
ncbi:Ig-like domain-containing protein [Undibacterium sp. Ji83W]|uniref:Ig-like domain-containing protein n=1 Tax=Undibacterium sp. Ji83W TaxID=3413043 RepID=UPI003BF2D2B0